MSFRSIISVWPELKMICVYSRRSCSVKSFAINSCAMPRMPFIGVLISCDMVARNWLFARLAVSA
ncbi:MAG: hypothetical protein ACD_10C00485G0002 [uncultured bacterium]|nr:MAG: hypothetical protein ACD_10C00485G0002 [uncultured bacterium]